MSSKRKCVQTPIEEKVKKLKSWQQNRHWTPTEAASELKVKNGTLLGWRKELSDANLSFVREPQLEEGRFRKSGAGPNHKLKSYESQVREYFDSCMADGGKISRAELRQYCRQFPEFQLESDGNQKMWVWRFFKRYQETSETTIQPVNILSFQVAEKADEPSPVETSPTTELSPTEIPSPAEPPSPLEELSRVEVTSPVDIPSPAEASSPDELIIPDETQSLISETPPVEKLRSSRKPLSVRGLAVVLSKAPTNEAETFLKKFNIFQFSSTPKISAHLKTKLPPDTIDDPEDITDMIPEDIIRICCAKVTTLQKKKNSGGVGNSADYRLRGCIDHRGP
ncbi:hypothetical protein AM587_10010005 [Phytophthora nicotianae]|uniref:Uncharacterized protein n=1 Tax=Phytophthora nicotianae TaxID=4792 RepID=A0A0W8CR51_PHYNI|nr:hypothetical protein AM587_10010005 [Phytophthora nicotianae]